MKCCLHKVCRVVWETESHQVKKVRQSRGLEIDLRGSEVVPAVVLQWWRPEGASQAKTEEKRRQLEKPCVFSLLLLHPGLKKKPRARRVHCLGRVKRRH